MNKTKIEWVKNPDGTPGYTWNPITGCLNGCEYCYARKLANGRLRSRYLANDNIANPIATGTRDDIEEEAMEKLSDPFYPRFWEDRYLDFTTRRIRHHNMGRRGIFVCDMSDLFGIGIPEKWTEKIMWAIKRKPQHRFYLLTKQPQNLIKFSPFPDNCWVGMTYTGKGNTEFGAGFHMEQVEAKVKFLSFEPLLARHTNAAEWDKSFQRQGIKWVIIGSQTKPYKPPKIEWVAEIVTACDKAGIPVFLKDNLSPIFAENDCKYFIELRDKLFAFKDFEPEGKTRWHLRQEMPNVS